jgi:hypothetical protein
MKAMIIQMPSISQTIEISKLAILIIIFGLGLNLLNAQVATDGLTPEPIKRNKINKKEEYAVHEVILFDPSLSPIERTIPSLLPKNIRSLINEIGKIPEFKSNNSVAVRLLFIERGYLEHPTKKYRMTGVFLGFDIRSKDGSEKRHMFAFDRDEVEFTREVLIKSIGSIVSD